MPDHAVVVQALGLIALAAPVALLLALGLTSLVDRPLTERASARACQAATVVGLVASLVLYPFQAWVRGARVPVTGIGSVAVSPEHRRRGIGEALVRACLREMRQRGDTMSMLYSFRADFYRRFGWGLIEMPAMMSLPPALLPASELVAVATESITVRTTYLFRRR